MARIPEIILGDETRIPILHEDPAVLAIDKPAGWMLAPSHWDRTGRNLQRALESSIQGGAFWARVRRLRYLRFIHRLDTDTSGVLLLARSSGVLRAISRLFEQRQVSKVYLAVVEGRPRQCAWSCDQPIGRQAGQRDLMQTHGEEAREAFTTFALVDADKGRAVLLARPLTGRTHQIRVHLAAHGLPVAGDALYNPGCAKTVRPTLGLRALRLDYRCPFRRKVVSVRADCDRFLRGFGFDEDTVKRVETACESGLGETRSQREAVSGVLDPGGLLPSDTRHAKQGLPGAKPGGGADRSVGQRRPRSRRPPTDMV